jgi:hypothetical protein
MNDEDIRQFMNAFEDFMKHSETEIEEHQNREKARHFTNTLLEKKAKELNVSLNYYLQEFV